MSEFEGQVAVITGAHKVLVMQLQKNLNKMVPKSLFGIWIKT